MLLALFWICLATDQRRHVWGQCVVPNNGDTNTPFYFFVNTNHPTVQSTWSLVISGATNLTLTSSSGSFTSKPSDPGCVGAQPYWFVQSFLGINVLSAIIKIVLKNVEKIIDR